MCKITEGFKLCTCAADQLSDKEIGWVLYRQDKDKKVSAIRGKPVVITFSNSDTENKEKIVAILNEGNCFDFDYEPQADDYLKIKVNLDRHTWYNFKYEYKNWQDDRSTSFSGWRQQLEQHERGAIES
jgi:hypothetical protein